MDEIEKLKEKLKTVSGQDRVRNLNKLAFAYNNSDIEKTKQYADQALELAKKLNCKSEIARSFNNLGIFYHRRGEYSRAKELYFKALDIFEEVDNEHHIASTKNNIGTIYQLFSNYEEALKFHFEALKIWEKLKDKKYLSRTFNNIGIIYEREERYNLALEYHLKSLKIKKEIKDTQNSAISYNNIGIIYKKMKNYDLAMKYYLKGLQIKKKIGEKRTIAISYINIGCLYVEKSSNDIALEYYLKALKIFEELEEKYGIIISCKDLGIIYKDLLNYKLAYKYLERSLKIACEIESKRLMAEAIKGLSELFEAQKDPGQALQYYKRYHALEKEIFNEKKSKQITEMQTKYEVDRKEKEAEIYRVANDKLKQEIKVRKKVEKEIKTSRERLKLLNKIIRHDLSNEFIVIKCGINIFKKKSDLKMLDNIEKRIDKGLKKIAEAKKYELFIETNSNLVEIELAEFLKKNISEFPGIYINIEGTCKVLGDDALNSVFTNLVSNSINHGKATQIDIKISSNKQCKIMFSDNGIGIPDKIKGKIFAEGFHYGKTGHTGIGLHIVKKTIKRYGGSISVEDNKPNGTNFIINLRKSL